MHKTLIQRLDNIFLHFTLETSKSVSSCVHLIITKICRMGELHLLHDIDFVDCFQFNTKCVHWGFGWWRCHLRSDCSWQARTDHITLVITLRSSSSLKISLSLLPDKQRLESLLVLLVLYCVDEGVDSSGHPGQHRGDDVEGRLLHVIIKNIDQHQGQEANEEQHEDGQHHLGQLDVLFTVFLVALLNSQLWLRHWSSKTMILYFLSCSFDFVEYCWVTRNYHNWWE